MDRYLVTHYCTFVTANSNGDPHIITLDGANFTFNGLGEYDLVGATVSNQYAFRAQARTELANTVNTTAQATVFTSLAAQQFGLGSNGNSSRVEFRLNANGTAVGMQGFLLVFWGGQRPVGSTPLSLLPCFSRECKCRLHI